MRTFSGGCHCGKVRFEVDAPEQLELSQCNCSVCSMTAYVHLIVSTSRFRLLQGDDALVTYRFGSGVAQHHFCKHCGIKSFYVPRSHPDGVSVNARCLDDADLDGATIRPFDGRNWEENHHEHKPLPD